MESRGGAGAGPQGHLTDKGLGELGVCDSNLPWSLKASQTPRCMLSFLLFEFGWPLECHPEDPL